MRIFSKKCKLVLPPGGILTALRPRAQVSNLQNTRRQGNDFSITPCLNFEIDLVHMKGRGQVGVLKNQKTSWDETMRDLKYLLGYAKFWLLAV